MRVPPPFLSQLCPFRAALQKKVGGMAAPMAENLDRYLAANPHCEVCVHDHVASQLPCHRYDPA